MNSADSSAGTLAALPGATAASTGTPAGMAVRASRTSPNRGCGQGPFVKRHGEAQAYGLRRLSA